MSNAIVSLEAAIAANPYDEFSYKTLIPLIKVDTDRVTVYREAYVKFFIADLAFWLDWLADAPSCELYEKALTNFPHFELANKYVEFASSLVEEEKLTPSEYRAILERMIIMCGSDVFTGSEMWKYYREFEVDEHEDLVELGATTVDIQKSKERFIKVYHRQLSLPLVGNEDTLREFEQKLGELCVASDASLINPVELEKKVTAAKETREGRLMYEMHILSDKYEASNLVEREAFWTGYIAFEKKQAQLSRTQRLFERAVMECPLSASLWLEFTDFALSVLKNWALLASVTKRALKIFRSSSFLWTLRLLSLEGSHEAAEELQAAHQTALSSGLSNVEEYLDIYLVFCDYYRRQLESTHQKLQTQKPASTELVERAQNQVDALQGALSQVQTFLASYGANWVAGWWRACKYHAQVEATLIAPVLEILAVQEAEQAGPVTAFGSKNASKKAPKVKLLPGSEVWESAVKMFPTSYFLWSEYVQWACHLKEFEHCRRVYRKMTNLQLDVGAAEVCKEWVRFEEQHGSLQDIQAALSRSFVHAQTELLQAQSSTGTAVGTAEVPDVVDCTDAMQVEVGAADGINRNKKRKAVDQKEPIDSDTVVDNESAKPSAKKVKTNANSNANAGTAAMEPVNITPPTYASASIVPPAGVSSVDVLAPAAAPVAAPVLSDNSVTVSNFPFHATMDSIGPMLRDKCTFSADDLSEAGVIISGSIVNMNLLLSKAGHSRGAVEVEFAPVATSSGESVPHSALKPFLELVVSTLHGYVYNERALKATIKVLPVPGAEKKEKVDPLVLQQRAGSVTAPHLTTVFVSHLAPEVTTAQLQEHFAGCGEVLAAKVAVDKKTGESKRTGLVQFATESGRSAALQLNKTQFYGECLGVAPSRFSLITVAQAPVEASHRSSAAVGDKDSSSRSKAKATTGTGTEEEKEVEKEADKEDRSHSSVPASIKPATLSKFSNTSFKPRNLVKQAPKGKIQL